MSLYIPANIVKIDRRFITRLGEDARTRIPVGAMISMAHDLGYGVVAEGGESKAALACLGRLGCNEVQGYLLAKPLLPRIFETWLVRQGVARAG